MSLLQMSISGAILISAITVIRSLTINRLPKKTFLLLWAIALARLLIPFSLHSSFSIYSLFQNKPIPQLTQSSAVTDFVEQAADYSTFPSALSAVSIYKIIWILGSIVCGLFFVVTYRKCYQEFQISSPIENAFAQNWLQHHPLKRNISLRQSDLISAPLTFGILHPVILMPTSADWNNEEMMRYVLTHEYIHIRRFDAVTKFIVIIALCIHWFNPLVWVMYILLNRDLELSCDETVVRSFDNDVRASYAKTLITMEESQSSCTPLCNNFSKNVIEERICAIMKTKKVTILSIIVSALLVSMTTVAFATTSKSYDNTVLLNAETTANEDDAPEITWWTAEEYEKWLQQEKKDLQFLLNTKNSWFDAHGKQHFWTQEVVDQQIKEYEKVLEDLKNGKQHAKPIEIDTDNDGIADTSIELSDLGNTSSACATQESVKYDVQVMSGEAASEDNSEEAMKEFAKQMKKYEKWGITYTPKNGGNVYYHGKLIRSFVDEDPEGNVLMVSSAKGGSRAVYTVYDSNGNISGMKIKSK